MAHVRFLAKASAEAVTKAHIMHSRDGCVCGVLRNAAWLLSLCMATVHVCILERPCICYMCPLTSCSYRYSVSSFVMAHQHVNSYIVLNPDKLTL